MNRYRKFLWRMRAARRQAEREDIRFRREAADYGYSPSIDGSAL